YTSYVWSTTATTQTIAATIADNPVTVQVTDANGCTGTSASVNVIENALPTPSITGTLSYCAGSNTTLDAGVYTSYLWSTTATTQTIAATIANNPITVQVTDANGCTGTSAGVNVVENALPATPTITAGGPTTFCAGGSVTLTSSAGTSYLWSNAATTASINVTTAGSYTVQVSDANGCQSAASVATAVTVNTLPTPAITGTLTYCAGSNTTLDAGVYTSYVWSTTATTQTIAATIADNPVTVQVTDANGCTGTSASVNVVENALPTPVITGTLSYCAGSTATLSVGAYTLYQWSTGATTQTIYATVADNPINVTVTDNCTGTSASINVIENALPTVSAGIDQTVCEGTSVTLSGSGALTYAWDNGITDGTPFTALTTTTYAVTGTDAVGCTNTDAVLITVNSCSQVDWCNLQWPTSAAVCNGTVYTVYAQVYELGVTEPAGQGAGITAWIGYNSTNTDPSTWINWVLATYNIDAGNNDEYKADLNLPAGVYYYASRFEYTAIYSYGGYNVGGGGFWDGVTNVSQVLTVNALPTVDAGIDQTVCSGTSVTLSGSGALTYAWDNGITDGTPFTALTTTTYAVTGTDANGCTNTDAIEVTVNNPTPVITGTLSYCAGSNTTLDAGVYTSYIWSNNATTQTIDVTAGTYDVTVTDACGTGTSASVTITENALPTPFITATLSYCAGSNTTLNAGVYTSYLWSTTETTQTITVTAGTYSIQVTDGNGCTGTSPEVTVVEIVNPTPSISGILSYCQGSSTDLDAGSYSSYSWSTSETTQMITVTAGTYDVTVTDSNGCTGTSASVVVTEITTPTPVITGTLTYCAGSTTTLDAGVYDSYLWSNNETTQTIDVTAGTYDVTVTDACGTGISASVDVTENPLPTGSTQITGPTAICIGDTTEITLSFTGVAPWSFVGDDGSGQQTFIGIPAQFIFNVNPDLTTTYTIVSVTDATGCTAQINQGATVIVNPLPVVNLGSNIVFCAGDSATLDAGNSGSTYLWSDASTDQTLTVHTADIYSVVVTDPNGCTGTDAVTVSVNALPTGTIQISGASTICSGDSTELTVSFTGASPWSFVGDDGSGQTTFSNLTSPSTMWVYPIQTTTYTMVSVTDNNGCTALVGQSGTVTVNLTPVVNLTGDTICYEQGDSLILDAGNPGASYLWSDGVNTWTTQTITVDTSAGIGLFTYYVTVSNGNCETVDSVAILIDVCNSAANINQNIVISMYPNPTKGMINISLLGLKDGEITILNIEGKELIKEQVENTTGRINKKIDLSAFPKGIYLVKFNNNNIVKIERIALQ
ncbi:MAG: T9SS type A sorting domain-containing protein, partial [Bacteroidia bacterium]|nr:T9SS type A sorting domain-containing protein [Bacteroidia bacterium]